MRRASAEPELDESNAYRLFTFLGVVSAATFFPLALLAWKVPPVEETIHRLSPLVVWCGVPALVCGLLFWRRMTARKIERVQTAGLAVGVLGAGDHGRRGGGGVARSGDAAAGGGDELCRAHGGGVLVWHSGGPFAGRPGGGGDVAGFDLRAARRRRLDARELRAAQPGARVGDERPDARAAGGSVWRGGGAAAARRAARRWTRCTRSSPR